MATLRQIDRNQDWRVVKIEEVNPGTGHIQARDQYDTPLMLDVVNKPALFQIPAVGELWTVRRRGSDWLLEARIDGDGVTTPMSSMKPGDARIEAPGDITITSGDTTSLPGVGGAGMAVITLPVSDTRNVISGDVSSRIALGVNIVGDADSRLAIKSDGSINFGNGTASFDTKLFRSGVGGLTMDTAPYGLDNWSYLTLRGGSTGGDTGAGFGLYPVYGGSAHGYEIYTENDAVDALRIYSGQDGTDILRFNRAAGGASKPGIFFGSADDTNLYRDAANTLKTDDLLVTAAGVRGIARTVGSSPPASPADGDIWIYNGLSGVYWMFVYDSSETTYKWKFIGGPPYAISDTGDVGTSGNTWIGFSGITATPRVGDYIVQFGDTTGINSGASGASLAIFWDAQLGNGTVLYDEPMYTRFVSSSLGIQNTWFTRSRGPIRLNALPASTTFQIWYSVTNWDTVSTNRHISYYPARW